MSYDDDSDGDSVGDSDGDVGNGQDHDRTDASQRSRPFTAPAGACRTVSTGAGTLDAYGGATASNGGITKTSFTALAAHDPDLALQVQKQERLAEVRARARGSKNDAKREMRIHETVAKMEAQAIARASAERSAEGKRFLGRLKPRPRQRESSYSDRERMMGGHPSEPRQKAPSRGQARRVSRVNWAPDLRAQSRYQPVSESLPTSARSCT